MKRLTLSLLAVAVLCSASFAQAAEGRKAEPTSVALVDMAHVFKEYKMFQDMQSGLRAEIEKSEAEAKTYVENLQALKQQLQETNEQFKAGSPQFAEVQTKLYEADAKFKAFQKSTQQRLARRESEMLKQVYAKVSGMVEQYARHAGYTMVLRFSRTGVEEGMQPQQAIAAMNKNVIFHKPGNDITDVVLRALNSKYQSSGTPARSVSDTQRRTR